MNTLMLVACTALIGSDPAPQADATQTRESLAGRWRVVYVSYGGPRCRTGEDLGRKDYGQVWVFTDDRMTTEGSALALTYAYFCDYSKAPRHITFSRQNYKLPGVFQKSETELWICYDSSGWQRPENFNLGIGTSESRVRVMFERER